MLPFLQVQVCYVYILLSFSFSYNTLVYICIYMYIDIAKNRLPSRHIRFPRSQTRIQTKRVIDEGGGGDGGGGDLKIYRIIFLNSPQARHNYFLRLSTTLFISKQASEQVCPS